jgi:hypothetical protein
MTDPHFGGKGLSYKSVLDTVEKFDRKLFLSCFVFGLRPAISENTLSEREWISFAVK